MKVASRANLQTVSNCSQPYTHPGDAGAVAEGLRVVVRHDDHRHAEVAAHAEGDAESQRAHQRQHVPLRQVAVGAAAPVGTVVKVKLDNFQKSVEKWNLKFRILK